MSSDRQADAFVRTILAQPDDATARLVFADWLDETGEPKNAAWARYIRARAAGVALPDGADVAARLTVPAATLVDFAESLFEFLPPKNLTVRLAGYTIPRALLEYMPESVARENLALPLRMRGCDLLLAMANPLDPDMIAKFEFILNRDVVSVRADPDDLSAAIRRHFGEYETESFDSCALAYPPDPPGP